MTARCIALLSGGLDSMLAIRIMQEQGIEVHALNFKTIFTCCQDESSQAARLLDVPLTVTGQEDDYLDIIREPRFGYGRGANPCVDCRIYMFEKAKSCMDDHGAEFIVSGEVIGQRPMSQKRRDLENIGFHSQLDDLLLRPLSAKLLPPTKPEREGIVDRNQLYDFSGRSRKPLIALAKKFGFKDIPAPSTGCALTERLFSRKVHDLFQLEPNAGRWDFDLLKYGRHFRFDDSTKVVVGRQESDNQQLEYAHRLPDSSSSALLMPDNYRGAAALLIGPFSPPALKFATGLLWRYGRAEDAETPHAILVQAAGQSRIPVAANDLAANATMLTVD